LHFHYVLSMGAVFALLNAWYFWIPKILGLDYNRMLGKVHFFLIVIYTIILQNKILIIYMLYYLVILSINLNNIFDSTILSLGDDSWKEFLKTPSSSPVASGSGGSNGPNDPNGSGGTIIPSSSSNDALEQKRETVYGKLSQLCPYSQTPNSGRRMNSSGLINLSFDSTDRNYMREHLSTFHPNELSNENVWGYIKEKGFSCKVSISKDRLSLFENRRN
jgi:hypothetical protein